MKNGNFYVILDIEAYKTRKIFRIMHYVPILFVIFLFFTFFSFAFQIKLIAL